MEKNALQPISPARSEYMFREFSDKPPGTRRYLWEPVLKSLSALPKGSRIFEAGCGNGSFAEVLTGKGFELSGIDLSETGVSHARSKVPTGHFRIASVYDDFTQMFDTSFDAVVSLEVIEHLYDPRTLVENSYNSLRPGGIFVVSAPYHGWLKNVAIAVSGKHDKHFNPLVEGGHIKFWSQKTLARLLQECNFKNIRFVGAGRLPFLWKSMILVGER